MNYLDVASHTETIICPSCGTVQAATVEHTLPFPIYVHPCECGYIVMESDWNRVGQKNGKGAK